ncbi:membrane protein [Bosea sp. ANAM02]|uniref:YeeE/YedE family protein n=1 Tax=Bosea sp. ANAM02 TaxID=2020412 RepID=UPI000646403D|nr:MULTISPECIES: membrane protein [Hyphomicrobiales]BCB20205.1 membrane protein [Bosea sp. ANAM02]
MIADSFTPIASLGGGALIGLAAVMLMLFQGRIAGISGIVSRLLPPESDGQTAGRVAMIAGLGVAPIVYAAITGIWPVPQIGAGAPVLVAAGLLVGFGSVWGNGCTSGHGICGLSRLSLRSLVAVGTFMATAIATVFVVRHLL